MPQTEKKIVRITVSVPADDHGDLERIAAIKKVSISWVVRDAIDEYLKKDQSSLKEGELGE